MSFLWRINNDCIVDLQVWWEQGTVQHVKGFLFSLYCIGPICRWILAFSILTGQPDIPSHTSPWTIWKESPPFSHPWSSPSRRSVWCPAPSRGCRQGSFQTWSQSLETQTMVKTTQNVSMIMLYEPTSHLFLFIPIKRKHFNRATDDSRLLPKKNLNASQWWKMMRYLKTDQIQTERVQSTHQYGWGGPGCPTWCFHCVCL